MLVTTAVVLTACGGGTTSPLQTLPGPARPAGVVAADVFAEVTERDRSPGADGEVVTALVEAANDFAIRFFQTVTEENPTDNVVVGNYSLSTALFLTMAGTGGETTDGFAELLGVEGIDTDRLFPAVNAVDLILESRAGDDLDIATANKLFVQHGVPLRDEFLDVAVASFGAPPATVDFSGAPDEVTQIVNDWVAEQTEGFIEKLTDGYPLQTVVVLANAMYLKAAWAVPFHRLGEPGEFTTSEGEVVRAGMMGHDEYLPVNFGSDFVAVELPYDGGNLTLAVIQPDDLDAFEADLTAARLAQIAGGFEESGIHLTMPVFSTETSIEALEPLRAMGMPNKYDFSTMLEDGESGYFIESISHRARIEVDETGTTAAAATDVVIAASHGPSISIDRPFFYVIRDKGSGTILFIGHITDPTSTD